MIVSPVVELAGGEGGEKDGDGACCGYALVFTPHWVVRRRSWAGPLANLASYFIVTCAARVDRTPS